MHEVTIDKLVHGGQGLGTLADGKKALVWNVLPGETVIFEPRRSKSSYVEGVAMEILKPSDEREAPRDELYLSTSPWQMMSYDAENRYKQEILAETFQRAGVVYARAGFEAPEEQWHYRNKMEYSFYGDDSGLHLALYNRGTHRKQNVTGSSIARPEIDKTAGKICAVLDRHKVRAGDLKSLIVRCGQNGETVAALFTKKDKFPKFDELEGICKGLAVVFSNPKSPASLRTRDLYVFGDLSLSDTLLEKPIGYDVYSFFQVNLPIFVRALSEIRDAAGNDKLLDFYGGSGSIGLSLPGTQLVLDSDPHSIEWARQNSDGVEIVHASAEKATDYIDGEKTVIVDPPRAGLHADVTAKLLEAKPPKIIYLSCNPSTQARDLELLQKAYKIKTLTGYNFFPRTPHIESLAILERA